MSNMKKQLAFTFLFPPMALMKSVFYVSSVPVFLVFRSSFSLLSFKMPCLQNFRAERELGVTLSLLEPMDEKAEAQS